MPRHRSVRVATLGSARERPVASSSFPSRAASALRRRVVATVLVVVSLALLTVYFRESPTGGLHDLQSSAASVLRPFEVAAERVARPFQDAAGWFGDLLDAKSENQKLRREVERYRQELIQSRTALRENQQLSALLGYLRGPRFPRDYRGVATSIIARPSGRFEQVGVVAAGSDAGIRQHDPVVTADGLVGHVTKAARKVSQITLLTDETSAASALDLKTGASGIVRHGESSGSSLILDRVTKDQRVYPGDVIVTAGWRSGKLSSIYPRGIPIGVVTSVGQIDYDNYKRIQVEPFVDFSSLESVLVLVKKER